MKLKFLAITTLGVSIVIATVPALAQVFVPQGMPIEVSQTAQMPVSPSGQRIVIHNANEAETAVLNTNVIRRKIQLLNQMGARVGVMTVTDPMENATDYYLVQLQEIKPEQNVTVDAFCVYRSGRVAWFDVTQDRCVSLTSYQ